MGVTTGGALVCPNGRTEWIEDPHEALKGSDRGLVELEYDYAPSLLPPAEPSNDGMWRYRGLLPIGDGPIRYPLAVGGTPLFAPPQLRRETGIESLFIKDETRSPTGSN